MSQAVGIAWSTVEDALQTWVSRGSGLPGASVYWAGQVVVPSAPPLSTNGQPAPVAPPPQNAPRPPAPCIAMRVSIEPLGQTDDEVISDNPSPSAGQEILHTFTGQRLGTLTLQCFADASTGTTGAVQRLNSVVDAVNFPSIYDDILVPAGIGISDLGPVRSSDGVINSAQNEPRAILVVKFTLASKVAEAGTYVETAHITNQITDTDIEVGG